MFYNLGADSTMNDRYRREHGQRISPHNFVLEVRRTFQMPGAERHDPTRQFFFSLVFYYPVVLRGNPATGLPAIVQALRQDLGRLMCISKLYL
jgi:hypothetical protein